MKEFFELLHQITYLFNSIQIPEWGIWSYVLLAFLVAVEGPIATLLAAGAAATGAMRPGLVFFSAAAGNLTADTLWYALGYAGKVEWILGIAKRMGVNHEVLERLERGMHEHAARILFVAKLSLSMVIPSLIAAGLVKAPWRRWFPFVACAETIWTGSLVLIGYYAASALTRVERGLEYIVPAGTLIFILFMVWLARRLLRKSTLNGDSQPPATPEA
jgi:membrane protein DedA with SNARE-associated domain